MKTQAEIEAQLASTAQPSVEQGYGSNSWLDLGFKLALEWVLR